MLLTIDLPSKGKLKSIPDKISINEWNLKDIKDLSKSTDSGLEDTLINMLNKNISKEGLSEGFNAGLLPSQDRIHIMLFMRSNIIGPDYSFYYYHSEIEKSSGKELCGHKNTIDIKLNDVVTKEIPEDYYDHVKVTLPSSKKDIRVCIPSYDYTRKSKILVLDKMELDIDKEETKSEDLSFFWTCLYISGLDDKRFGDIIEAMNFVDSLNYKDASALYETVKYFKDWGPQIEIERACEKCNRRFTFRIPFFSSFFFDKGERSFDIRSSIKPKQEAKRILD